MGRKVVYCPYVGGFELSPKAIKRYFELTQPEVTLYFYRSSYDKEHKEWLYKINLEDIEKSDDFITIFSVDLGESIKAKDISDEIFRDHYISAYDIKDTIERHDPKLIQVVEELGGKEASGSFESELEIKDIGDSKYHLYVSDETDAEGIITELPEGFWK